MVKAIVASIVLLAAGCDYITDSFVTNPFSGDPFPTTIGSQTGALMTGFTVDGDTDAHTAVLDVMSPMNVIDRGPDVAVTVNDDATFQLYGEHVPFGPFDLERANFADNTLTSMHPCSGSACMVGSASGQVQFDAIIGMPAFVSDALRLDLAPDPSTGTDTVYVLPNVAGSEAGRSYSCDADYPVPFRGGGTIVIGGTELQFTNWRIAIDACLSFDPDPTIPQSQRGTDVLFVASTATGVSILGLSAYQRYQLTHPSAPDADTLPASSVTLENETITGNLTTIPTMALVANSPTNPRAPCRQVWANHLLVQRDCLPTDDCPCIPDQDPNNGTFCAVPAEVELAPPSGFPVLIVDDANDTLQALTTELSPDQPQVDGILGTSALRQIELDVDYPDDRLLARCTDPTLSECDVRPELPREQDRAQVQGCDGSGSGG
ncbi:MAG TPA: hypothetical protein VGG74_12975 [Kofleriaceae bacterium]